MAKKTQLERLRDQVAAEKQKVKDKQEIARLRSELNTLRSKNASERAKEQGAKMRRPKRPRKK